MRQFGLRVSDDLRAFARLAPFLRQGARQAHTGSGSPSLSLGSTAAPGPNSGIHRPSRIALSKSRQSCSSSTRIGSTLNLG